MSKYWNILVKYEFLNELSLMLNTLTSFRLVPCPPPFPSPSPYCPRLVTCLENATHHLLPVVPSHDCNLAVPYFALAYLTGIDLTSSLNPPTPNMDPP